PQGSAVSRLSEMRDHPDPHQLLHDVPPTRGALHRELRLLPVEAQQPLPQMRTVRGCDAASPDLSQFHVHVVEGDLATMQIEGAYDHQGPPRAPANTCRTC